jgi:hypothetical protein
MLQDFGIEASALDGAIVLVAGWDISARRAAAVTDVTESQNVVKALEWHEHERGGGSVYAETIIGRYSAWENDAGSACWRGPNDYGGNLVHGDLAVAKAAAYLHYLAALAPALDLSSLTRTGEAEPVAWADPDMPGAMRANRFSVTAWQLSSVEGMPGFNLPLYAHPATPAIDDAAVERARHWIDRYAAGIDEEPQMDRIIAALLAAQGRREE